jgi:catechol 2,3-dioxygenase-like lactoylglutathione lyase family enzyme
MSNDRLGRLNRREVLTMLGALAAGKAGAQEPLLRVVGLDHVSILGADAAKSIAFYRRIFGHHVLKGVNGDRRYFMIGNCYIAIASAPAGQPRRADHFCTGIEGFDSAGLKTKLDQRGIASRPVNVGLYVDDPDGIVIQLWNMESWKLNQSAPEPPASGEEPLFRPIGLDHLLLGVPDPEKSLGFYQKLFGPASQRTKEPPRDWFQFGKSRLGLAPLAAGQRPGIDHFCVAVEKFDQATAVKGLEARGAVMHPESTPASPQFRDPDGVVVQVIGRG